MYRYGLKYDEGEHFRWLPLRGLMGETKDESGNFDVIVSYNEELSGEECEKYRLTDLNEPWCDACRITFTEEKEQ